MNSQRQADLQTIRDAINHGELTPQQLEQRLNALIDAEFAAQDHPADAAYIELCLDLLAQVQTGGSYHYTSHKDAAQAVVTNEYKHKLRKRRVCSVMIKASCAAVVLVLLLGTVFHQSWLSGSSTSDGQQYIISLKSVDIGASSEAGNEETFSEPVIYSTSILQSALDACSFLDTLSPLPQIPYTDAAYTVINTDTHEAFMAFFHTENGSMHLDIRQFHDTPKELVRVCFEQNGPGREIQLTPTVTAYESCNVNRPFIVWHDDTTVCYVSTDMDAETCRSYAAMLCDQLQ